MIGGKKKCIGLIFGGHSNEHEVSISSAKTVFQAFNAQINKERFTVKPFYISKYGDWLDSHLSEKILIGGIENNKTNKQEIFNPKNSSQIMGRTRTNRLTFVEIPKNINFNFSLGDEINVRINEARPFSLTGELSL